MKKILLSAAIFAACFPYGYAGETVKTGATRPDSRQEAFRFMPKAEAQNVFGVSISKSDLKMKAAANLASKSLPEGDDTGFLETPDGEPWYFVAQYTKDAGTISHFSYTIYDSSFSQVAVIEDDVELGENETRIVDVQLGYLVTKKFFNSDDNPEFMVAIAANTPEYVNHYYTKVYSSGSEKAIASFEGYWCVDVNTSTDEWSENFYIGFMTEQDPEQSEIGGVMNSMDYVVDIYKKAGFGSSCEIVQTLRIPSLLSSGESWIPVLATAHNGDACFAVDYLKYSFYENPFDWQNENPTQDNEFIIDYYEIPRYGSPKTCRTSVKTSGSASDLNFYYLGGFMFEDDITYGRYTDDDIPAFTVTRAHYETSSDDYSYSFYVYPAGSEENPASESILTLGENINGFSLMSDVRGCDPQAMFIRNDNGNYTFDFVNLIDGTVECSLPYSIADNIFMNAGADRVAGNNGSCLYAVAQYTAETDADGNAIQIVAYVNPDGSLHHADHLNLGQDVAYAEVFNNAYALDPYIFNTDAQREYMVLVKRYLGNGSSTREELMVISPTQGALLTILPDEELGNISFVELDKKSDYGQNLYIVYQNEDFRLNTVRYELPLYKFAGGDGSASNPYQIATLGDLRQVKFNRSASYVLVSDIDARDSEMEHVSGNFAGSFDGGGHNIIGPDLRGHGLFESIDGAGDAASGVVINLNIIEPTVTVADNAQAGILADAILGAKISGVNIYDAVVNGETPEVNATFGSIAGSASYYSEISGCAVMGSSINLPESSIGGIAGQIATSTTIRACSYSGDITGGTMVGGIVGSTIAAGDVIEDCHVDAEIVAKNTIGGIAGTSSRGVMQRCHVQGSIESTEAPRWGGGPSTGGLIGDLASDYSSGGDATPVIKGNFINLSSLKAFDPEGEPNYEGEYDTFHRIIGKTCANEEPMPIFDENWNIIGYEDVTAESILADNYAADNLSVCNNMIPDDAASTEGKTISSDELGREFFENLGYAYGYELGAPWNEVSAKSPRLYFEGGMILFDMDSYGLVAGTETDLQISLFGERIDAETLGCLTVDIADESIIEYVSLDVADDKIVFTVNGIKAGTTTVTANYNGHTAQANVSVFEVSGIENVNANASSVIDYSDGVVTAERCRIEVYAATGAKVLVGYTACDLSKLSGGVYVIRAIDESGRTSSLKVMR